MDRFEVRVSITKVLLILIVVIVPLSVIGLIFTERSDKSLDSSIGNDFKALAETYSNEAASYIQDRVTDVNSMAEDSSIVDALSGAGAGGTNSSGRVERASAKESGTSHASEFLRQRRNLDPRFISIAVTDENGAVVASAQPQTRSDYSQDDTWQGAYNKGQGAVKISDVLDDELTKSYYVDVDVPIGDPNSGHLIGVLSAAVNISPLLARFQQDRIGNGAQAVLVNEDGTVVSGPNADVFARVKSQDFDAVRDSLGSLQGRQSGWSLADLRSGPYLIGYAATGLKQHFDNLGWVVLISEPEHQAAAPIRQLERFAIVMVILAGFMLTLLCVYYFLHRSQRFEDIEEALPPDVDRTTAASA